MYEYRLDDMYAELIEMKRLVRQLLTQAPVGFTAVTRGALRVASNEGLLVEGSAKVDGWLIVTGMERVTGRLEGSGTLDWEGPWVFRGDGDITGNVDIAGEMTVTTTGQIKIGSVTIDRGGAWDGRISATSSLLLSAPVVAMSGQATANDFFVFNSLTVEGSAVVGDLDAVGTVSANIKNFKIPHPTEPDHVLRHGSTESPVSGVEYWGEETLPESGELTVTLPEYFEALTKPDNRPVLVTARGFLADWGDVEDGAFTVTGTPGGRFSWLVKAERDGADFPTVEAQPAQP